MRDVILKEIGQNIYDHAGGRCALVTIGTIPPIPPASSRSFHSYQRPLEESFFKTLGRSGYLQVIIADHGPGIFSKLAPIYATDNRIREEDRLNPSEPNVIAYAFEFDSTSKFKDLLSILSDEDPGRGLYWVREIVLQNQGLLTVRSGSSLIRYDFLNTNDRGRFRAYPPDPRGRSLAPLGGTQFRLLFPLNPKLFSNRALLRNYVARRGSIDPKARVSFAIAELPHQALADAARRLDELQASLGRFDYETAQAPERCLSVAILDFRDTTWQKDVLVPFLVRLASIQHENVAFVIANTHHLDQLLQVASPILRDRIKQAAHKLRPILVWNEDGLDLLGADPLIAHAVLALISESIQENDGSLPASELRQYDHLVECLGPETQPRFLARHIEHVLLRHHVIRLQEMLLSESHGIYHEGKFLLPTNVYVDGYFQLADLTVHSSLRQVFRLFIRDLAQAAGKNPSALLSLSSDLNLLTEALAAEYGSTDSEQPRAVLLAEPRTQESCRHQLEPHTSQTLLLLCTVIGTGKTLSTVLEASQQIGAKVLGVVAVVDARDRQSILRPLGEIDDTCIRYAGETLPLRSILVHSLRFYEKRPVSWNREDIIRIDPATNAPSPDKVPPAVEPLWQPADSFFLANVASNAKALHIGHFQLTSESEDEFHYIYFFDFLRLANSVGPEIARKIKGDVLAYCRNSQSPEASVSHVVFDDLGRGSRVIAGEIARAFGGMETLSLQAMKAASRIVREGLRGRDVVIFLNSVASGSRLRQMLDAAARCQPRRMFAYALLHRRESDEEPFYQRIGSYSSCELRFRYFVELEIPAFNRWDCPACNARAQLRDIFVNSTDDDLRHELAGRIGSLAPQRLLPQSSLPPPAVPVEVVEQARVRRMLGAAKTDLQARYPLSDIIDGTAGAPDDRARVVEVLAREAVLFATYSELLYPKFVDSLVQTCLELVSTRTNTVEHRESAILTLSHLAPVGLLENLIAVVKGCLGERSLRYLLFAQLLRLATRGLVDSAFFGHALDVCRSALNSDRWFFRTAPAEIAWLQHMLGAVHRQNRLGGEGATVGQKDRGVQATLGSLWIEFMDQPGRIHPALVQQFTELVGIHSLSSFREAYAGAFGGSDGFSVRSLWSVSLIGDLLPYCRGTTRQLLSYFVSQAATSFERDLAVIEDSLRTMATLDAQRRLTDEEVDRIFYHNDNVNTAIARLKQHAFGDDSTLKTILRGKFCDIGGLVTRVTETYRERLQADQITLKVEGTASDGFVPESVLYEVLGHLMENSSRHAFSEARSELAKEISIHVVQKSVRIVVSVTDNGKGIRRIDLERRPDRGLQKSIKLLAYYDATIRISTADDESPDTAGGAGAHAQIEVLTKEEVLSCKRT